MVSVQVNQLQDDMIALRRERDSLAGAYHAESEKLIVAQARLEDMADSLETRTSEMQRLVEANRRLQLQVGEAKHWVQEEGRGAGAREDVMKKHRELEEEYMR